MLIPLKRHVIQSVFFLFISLLLTACGGGGGGGGGGNSPPRQAPQPEPDTTPNNFSFEPRTDVELGVQVTSNSATIQGIDVEVPVSIEGGEYSLDGGSFTNQNGTLAQGQSLVLRLISAEEFGTQTSATVTVGAVNARFEVTTEARDTTPESFNLASAVGVELGEEVFSDVITVSGINTAVPVAVTGGQYRIDQEEFTDTEGVLTEGQTVQVKGIAPSAPNTSHNVELTIGTLTELFTLTTRPPSDIPNAFSFASQMGVGRGTLVTSNPVTIEGIEVEVPVSIEGGEYALDGGGFTDQGGTLAPGQSLVLRVSAAEAFSTQTSVIVTVGGVTARFEVTTRSPDITPESFSFEPRTGVELGVQVTSNSVTIESFEAEVPVSIEGGEYTLDGGNFTDQAETATPGQSLALRLTAADEFEVQTSATVTVGGVSARFEVTTEARDTTPESFSFAPANDVNREAEVVSDVITVLGINTEVAITVTGGQYRIDGGEYTDTESTVSEGQTVQVKGIAPSELDTSHNVELTIGALSELFTITTRPPSTTPDNFGFTSQVDVTPNTWVLSETMTVTGITEAVSVSIDNGEYRIDEQGFTNEAGSIEEGQQIQVRQLTADTLATETVSTLTIGEVDGTFNTTTSESFDNTPPEWTLASELPIQQQVTTNANGAQSVFAADLDGDGDQDLLSASFSDDIIAWYENDGAADPAFTRRVITSDADGALSVFAADLDGDGNLDVLSASVLDNTIAWYENDGAVEPTFTKQVISMDADARSVFAADVDEDGDTDVLSASVLDNTIAWYENNGAANPVFTKRTITSSAIGATSVFAADIDGDGDMDVLSASLSDDLNWYENNGAADPAFTEQVISTANGTEVVFAADLDGDGDMDVLSALTFDATIVWHENDGAADPVFTDRVITMDADGVLSVMAADVDGDGDMDVLSASSNDNTIAWYENDGASDPTFIERQITTTADGPRSVFVADVNGDEDLEVLSASRLDNTIAWYPTTQRLHWLSEGDTLSVTEDASDTDGNPLSYAVSHGSDAGFFTIDTMTGDLNFADAPPVSAPEDANADNVYEVWISVTDGFSTLNRSVSVRIFVDDEDDDNDGVPDTEDAFPLDPTESVDTDMDGVGNNADPDDDGDGVEDEADKAPLNASNALPPEWVQAGQTPIKQVVTTLAGGASSVFAADLDGDGDQDLVSSSEDDDTIAWYESDGAANPGFTLRVITTSARSAQSVFVVDVDGDGDQDLLSASFGDHTIAWYENDGAADPEFTERVITTAASGARSVFAADLDGDGDMDLLSASLFDDTIAWYENNGAVDPVFTTRTITLSASGATSVFAADIDGDGDMDVLSASEFDDTIAWHENDGAADPAFTGRVITLNAKGAQSVFAADVDGDGDMDVLSASAFDDTIAWYENDGVADPTFIKRQITTAANRAQSVFATDVDGDGDTDVLSASAFDDTIIWFENDGMANPTFTRREITAAADGAQSVFAVDLDGDDNLEVLSASSEDNTIAWYRMTQRRYWLAEGDTFNVFENAIDADGNPLTYTISHGADASFFGVDASTGELTFADAPPASSPEDANADNVYEVWLSVTDGFSTLNRPISVRVFVDDEDDDNDGLPDSEDAFPLDPTESVDTDMDGVGNNADSDDDDDGIEDEADNAPLDASSTSTPEWVQVAQAPVEQVVTTNADGASSVFAADLDGDGDQDLLSASENDDTIAWYENDGVADPDFIRREITTFALGAQSVFAADMNGDGDLDVLSASEDDDTIAWYENDGSADPVFTERVITTAANGAQSVFAVDLDSDGDLDVLSASEFDNTIAWYENDGRANPAFSEQLITTAARRAQSVFAADLDGDGDLDVLSASDGDDAIAWYENDGTADPEFVGQIITKTTKGAQSVFAADMDSDGDMDILSASNVDDTVSWHENDGAENPIFTERIITTNLHNARSALAVDVDGDGDLDVLSASFNDNTIAWYENDGAADPVFIEREITTDAEGARSAFAADLDGDGDLEVLSASFWDDTIAWYRTTQRRYQVTEGNTLMVLENAGDMDGNLLSYAVSHGPDASFFTIDAMTGDLTFADAPPVSAPEDTNGDNIYEVWISVSDGFSRLTRSVAVEVQAAN